MITELAQLNHENQIHQTLQVAALSITTNPYQGLKLLRLIEEIRSLNHYFQLPLIPIRD